MTSQTGVPGNNVLKEVRRIVTLKKKKEMCPILK